MASIVKGTIGDQQVELNNAATESTLLQMLALAKQDSATLKEWAKKAGVDAKAIEKASKAMDAQAGQSQTAGKNIGAAGNAASLMGGFLMDMGQSVMATGKNLVQFGDELLEGKARASDLFKAFKDLPLGLGLVATIFQKALQYQEKNLDIYRQISSTGAGLNGTLNELRTKAFGVYLTMEELAGVYKTNADVFKALGGSASAGSKAFLEINQKILRSDLGDNLLAMGYNFEQVNNLLGGYLRVSGDGIKVGRDAAKEQERLAKAAAHYGEQLDFMARLQGESREALEQKMAAEAQEASWQLHLAGMDEKAREKANDALMRANAMGGKGAMDALKAQIMGFAAPFSEEGRNFVSLFGEGSRAIENMARVVKDGTSAEEASVKLDKLLAQGVAGNIKDMKGLTNVINAMGLGGTEMAKGIMDVVKSNSEYIKTGRISAEQIEEAIKQTKERQKADSAAAAAAATNEKRMKEVSNQINMALLPVMELLAKHANGVVKAFADFIGQIDLPQLGRQLAKFMEGVMNYVKNIFSDEGQTKILNDIKYWFQLLLIELKQAIIPWYTESDAEEERKRLDGDKKVIDARAEAAREIQEKTRLTNQLELLTNEEKFKKLKEQVSEDQALVKSLKSKKEELSEDEKKQLEDAQARLRQNEAQVKSVEKMTEEQKAAAKQKLQERITALSNTTNQATAKGETHKERERRVKAEFDEAQANIDPMTGLPRATGSIGTTGSILENFGKGTPATLHGKEGVLTEKQMTNLATGAMDTGAAAAQEKLANAVLSLNKQQALTNQILGQIADYTRRTAESPNGKWGNAFARI